MGWLRNLFSGRSIEAPPAGSSARELANYAERVRQSKALADIKAQKEAEFQRNENIRKIENELDKILYNYIGNIHEFIRQSARNGYNHVNITDFLERVLLSHGYSSMSSANEFSNEHDILMSHAAKILQRHLNRRGFTVRYVHFEVTRSGIYLNKWDEEVSGTWYEQKKGVEISW
jgi:hypothetical protein